jgi:hypothetical protein
MAEFPEEPLNLPASEGFGCYPAYPGLKVKMAVMKKIGTRTKAICIVGCRFRVSTLRNFASSFFDYAGPRGDNDCLLALKILTAHATLQKTKELKKLQAIARLRHYTGLPYVYDNFTENSHHGRHLYFGLGVLGPSIEDIRLSSPTKTLPVHVVQKVVKSTLEALMYLLQSTFFTVVCISPIHSSRNYFRNLHIISVQCSCYTRQYHIFVGQERAHLDPIIATLPPCTVERKVIVDGLEYPIVRSQPLPYYS